MGSEESGMLLKRKWLRCWELEAQNDGKAGLGEERACVRLQRVINMMRFCGSNVYERECF